MNETPSFSAFVVNCCVASGPLETIMRVVKLRFDRDPGEAVLIFDDRTGRQVDFDFRGTDAEVVARAVASNRTPDQAKPGPGRPKLGIISREISLLPRQWEWLEQQPNGISAALRRLVDEARKRDPEGEKARLAREAASSFMTAIAGNFPGFEEASRALFAKDNARLRELVGGWPKDIQAYLLRWLQP